jgi:hypothetical protein
MCVANETLTVIGALLGGEFSLALTDPSFVNTQDGVRVSLQACLQVHRADRGCVIDSGHPYAYTCLAGLFGLGHVFFTFITDCGLLPGTSFPGRRAQGRTLSPSPRRSQSKYRAFLPPRKSDVRWRRLGHSIAPSAGGGAGITT